MKKLTISLIAVLSAVCLNGFAQTIVDAGIDWNGTATVAAATSIPGAGSVLINEGTANEVKITTTVSAGNNNVYTGKIRSVDIKADDAYAEFSLTDNSSSKLISEIKVNGVHGNGSAEPDYDFVILYSDKAPFDEESVIGYKVVTFPAGGKADETICVTSGIAAPTGCKSYRFYRTASYDDANYGTSGKTLRIAYLSATLVNDPATSINFANAEDKEIVSVEYFDTIGKKTDKNTQGLIIVKTNYADGTFSTAKSINK